MSELDAFRAEIRGWLEANFSPSLKGKGARYMMGGASDAEFERWKTAMGEKGYGTPTWPKAYGGAGLSMPEVRVISEEMGRLGAWNPIGGMGVMMFGPTLLEYGTEAQKQRHIPGIVKGEVRWCQGYSEPGSGSDLASLQTKCEDKGDHYLINGQKIWTSGANHADWCFCLVRTDTTKKHEGISFILIDMKTPGVETRPILLINGTSPFCETFFTDVKVPKENLVGPLNGGWTIGKRLLQFERQNISASLGGSGALGSAVRQSSVEEVARQYVSLEDGVLADGDYRTRLVDHMMTARAFTLTGQRAAAEARAGDGPSAATSIMKYAGAKLAQDRQEMMIEAMGAKGLGWEGAGFSETELGTVRAWLRAKANSIEGGTSEINLNVVAKRVLALPDPR